MVHLGREALLPQGGHKFCGLDRRFCWISRARLRDQAILDRTNAGPGTRVVEPCICGWSSVRGKKEVATIVWSYPMVPIVEKLLNVEPGKCGRSS